MKKALKELNVEEFTRLLCEWPATHTISLKAYDKDSRKIDEDTVTGTYDQLSECTLPHKKMHKWVEDNIYDYKTPVSDIEVYDYLSEKTHGFEPERVRILRNEMDFWHSMYISEEKQDYAFKQYEMSDWEIPWQPRHYIPFTDPEDPENRWKWADVDAMVKKVFGEADEFPYQKAMAILDSKVPKKKDTVIIDSLKQKFEGLQTDEFINLLFGYVPSRINYLMADPFMLGLRFLVDNKDLQAKMKEVEQKMELLYAEFYGRLPVGNPREKLYPGGIQYSALQAAARGIRKEMVEFLMGWIDKYKDEEGYEDLIKHCTHYIKCLDEVGLEPIYTKKEYTNYLKAVTDGFDKEETKDLVESLDENAWLTYCKMCKLAENIFEHNKWDIPQYTIEYPYYDGETDEEVTKTDYITAYDCMVYRFFGDTWAKRFVQVIDILAEKTGMDFSDGKMYSLCMDFGKTNAELETPTNKPATMKVSPEEPIDHNSQEYLALAGIFDTTQFDEKRIDKLYNCLRNLKSDANAHNTIAALAELIIPKSYCRKKKLRQVVAVFYPIAGVDERWVKSIRSARIGKNNREIARKEWRHISLKGNE